MIQEKNKTAVIILAAGKGTRMKMDIPKVLATLAGRPMLSYVYDTAKSLHPEKIIVVVGHKSEEVMSRFNKKEVEFVLQKEQLGTAHAVLQTKEILQTFRGNVIILSGDVPLLRPISLEKFLVFHNKKGGPISLITAFIENPSGYGRILRKKESNTLFAIREEKDLKEEEKGVKEINAGIYCFDKQYLFNTISDINTVNAQGEYYLTDIIEIAVQQNLSVHASCIDNPVEIMGVNTRDDLKRVSSFFEGNI